MQSKEYLNIENALKCFPEWTAVPADTLTISPLSGGLTNTSYLIVRDKKKYVLRICSEQSGKLNINRQREYQAQMRASESGIGVPLEAFALPQGHMLTGFIEGESCTREEFNQADRIVLTAALLKKAHQLPPIRGAFDPYEDILDRRNTILREGQIELPEKMDLFLKEMERIKRARENAPFSDEVLCHNDPFWNNFLYVPGRVYLLDWEFAGMGDRFFDIASVTQVMNGEGRQLFLRKYFAEDTDALAELTRQLELSRFVVMLWNALWALLQDGRTGNDHDYAKMAQGIFANMDNRLQKNR